MSASNTMGAPGSRAEGRHSERINEAAVIVWVSRALCGCRASMTVQAKAFLSQMSHPSCSATGHVKPDLLWSLHH